MYITKREQEVIQLMAYENTTQDTAHKLFISPHTALSHRKNLMHKLNARNTAGLVRRAFEIGHLTLNSNKSSLHVFPFSPRKKSFSAKLENSLA